MSQDLAFPKFISNDPFGADQLSSGSQQKIALSIADHIRNNSTDFKLIGLDGEWGSGKSNVIQIIQKELGSDFYTFIYDAWSHQEDLQRRSFLEELTDQVQAESLVPKEKWNRELKNLLAKKKNTVTKTIPKLGYGIIASILLALAIPITSAVADVVKPDWIKIPIAALPLIAGLVIWLILLKRDFNKYKNLENLFYLYKEKDLTQETDEVISEDEPSVREFRRWMEKLSADLNKNLLVVFDNMDRLPSEKVQILWASIHTFFSEKHYNRIWVIVPFDRKHIQQAFGENVETPEKTNHFINKTFSVIYNVAPVVLTDWKEFYDTKFGEAFGNTEKTDQKTSRYLFDRHTDIITPRKIIAFINDLVALKMIWKKDIDLRYMALYVLNKEQLLKNPSQILNSHYLQKGQSVFSGDDTVLDNLAALMYNVPLTEARQLTLLRETELAIRRKRYDELIKLAAHPDFYLILEQIQAEDMEVDETVVAMEKLEEHFGDSRDPDIFTLTWSKIITKQLSTQLQNQEFTRIHKMILLKARPYKRKLLIEYLIYQFRTVSNFKGDLYYRALSELEEFIKENEIPFNILASIEPRQVSAEEAIAYLKAAGTNYKKYKVSFSPQLVEQYFLTNFSDRLQDAHVLGLLDEKFTILTTRIEKEIKENVVTIETLDNVFAAYKAVSGNVVLKEKLADSTISNLLAVAQKGTHQYYELVAMRIGRNKDFPNYGGVSNEVNLLTDEKLVQEVAARIKYYNNYGVLLTVITEWNVPLLKEVLLEITLRADKTLHKVASVQVLTKLINITAALDITGEQLMSALDRWSPYFKAHTNTKTLKTIIADPQIFGVALRVKNNLGNAVLGVAAEYVNEATEEDWKTGFSNDNDYLFCTLVYLLKSKNITSLNSIAFSAYKEALLAIEEGKRPVPKNDEDWNLIYDSTERLQLVGTLKTIRDNFRNKTITSDQFLFFERMLRENGHLKDVGGDVVRKILKPVITNKECLSTIVSNQDFYLEIILNSGIDLFDFIESLRKTISAQGEEQNLLTLGNSIDKQLAPAIQIRSAHYHSTESDKKEHSNDVTTHLDGLLKERNLLFFKVTNELLGCDPHPGKRKKLDVEFTYNDQQMRKSAFEGEWIGLP